MIDFVRRQWVTLAVGVGLACGGGAAPLPTPAGPLDRLAARIDASGATVGLYYRDLDSGDSLAYAADRRYHAASTMKVPVMMQVFRDRDAGLLSLEDSVPVTRTFASIVDGSPYDLDVADDSDSTLYARVGGRASIRELVELMITVSSNLATNILISRVGPERANATAHAFGADSIAVLRGVEDGKAYEAGRNNTTTARDLGRVLAAIADGHAASDSSSREMLAILGRQRFNEGIPALLPPGTTVAHKTGSITALYHDAGIVTTPSGRRYVLVILTRGLEKEEDAHRLVAELSKIVYEERGR
jgi:beta-lactamase class A